MVQGPQRVNPDISYRYTREPTTKGGRIKHVALASHPEQGIISSLVLSNDQWPNKREPWGRGLGVETVYTHPDFRQRGIASALYNIASRQLGYAPEHDQTRTKSGNAFAQKVSGGEGGRGHIPGGAKPPYPMPSWELEDPGTLPEKQSANWMRGEKIDPVHAAALTPQKPPTRRGRKPKQLALPLE